MKCPACSADVPEGARYCPACAQPVGSASQLPTGLATPSVAEAAVRRGASDSPVGRFASSPSLDGGGFAPGTILGERYRIIGLVGHGGMGEVYRADDLKLGQPVALKFLAQKLTSELAFIERFYAEVRHARGVSHPNVCRVYDVGEIEGRHFLSMEYVDGEDLASLLRRIGRLPPDKAVEIARELCAGLAAAHDKGVLHRDLKPANVMIDGRGRAKITDFGLAVGVNDDKGGAEVSGTPAYMAPEQLAGKGASIQSDIYALGLVLYELFTGRKAFEAATLAEWRRKHAEEPPTSPSTVTPGFDPVVERVILRCLEKDPKARPRSVAAVAAALPGGDPLAAAIAAGETPSPEMVAAAGSDEGMKPAAAWACLVATLAGMLLTAYITPRVCLPGAVHLDKSPEVLAERARQIVQKLGYTGKFVDSARGFRTDRDYLRWVERNDKSPERWKDLAGGRPAAYFFWYRQSPVELVALSLDNLPGVFEDDPPLLISGMLNVRLDPLGRLIALEAVPPQIETGTAAPAPVDWSPLFTESGLDPAKFIATPATWLPPTYADTRMAWVEVHPEHADRPLRIEAAAYRGLPVYFELVGPWSRATRATPAQQSAAGRAQRILVVGMLLIVSVGGLLIARRNLRLGRGDRRGASRLAVFVLICFLVSFLFEAHFVATGGEVSIMIIGVAVSTWFGALTWIIYIALEPIVRRRWPDTLISWTRLLSGKTGDPLVGQAILAGGVCGAYSSLAGGLEYLLRARLEPAPPAPYQGVDITLRGIGPLLGSLVGAQAGSLVITMAFMVFFLIVRALLRKEALAAAVFIGILAIPSFLAGGWIAGVFQLVFVGAHLFVFLRFGLLALVFASLFGRLLDHYLTLDPSSWYFGASMLVLAVLAALAIYGFRIALAGRPLFSGMRLEDSEGFMSLRRWLFGVSVTLLVALSLLAQEGYPLFTTDFPPEEFAARRAKVYDAIGKDAFAVVQGATMPPSYTRFRQTNEFYYLCGIEVPNAYIILDGGTRKATLYLPHRNERRERGEGRMLSAEDAEEVKKLSGVDAVAATDVFAEQLEGKYLRRGQRILFTPLAPAELGAMSRDLALRFVADLAADPFDGRASREGHFVALIRERFPVFEIRDLSPTLDALRLIKSERELAMIRSATKLAGLAILEGMHSTRPGQYERELDGVGKFVFYRNGAQGDAYYSLIGSGPNAYWGHYNAGKRLMQDGDFLLMDYAPDFGYYMSDVTRMFPVNGKFSGWQRELYGFYLGCYREILKAIAPGKTGAQIIQQAGAAMDPILAAAKFTKPSHRKAAEDFVAKYKKSAESEYPYIGHWVGMATHDVGSHEGPLKAGMVFTIEPALTVPEEKINVRLEDVVFITDKGAEVVSTEAPWDIDAIEKAMREEGMLERYPRVIPASGPEPP